MGFWQKQKAFQPAHKEGPTSQRQKPPANGLCALVYTTTENNPRASDEGSQAGDPGDTDKRDPAAFPPEGSGRHGGSVTRICTEVRKQGLHDHGRGRHLSQRP